MPNDRGRLKVKERIMTVHIRSRLTKIGLVLVGLLFAFATSARAQEMVQPAPDRGPDEGQGPFDRLILRGAIVIDGTGGPPRGPVDIVIEGNRIARIAGVGVPGVPIDPEDRPEPGTKEYDVTGMYVLPGFVDLHLHTGGVPKAPEAEYVYKLWMAHGITTGRGVPFGGVDWSLSERERSARNEIVAPRMFVYHVPGQGWDRGAIRTPEDAREWVRWAADKGIDGIKLFGYQPDIMAAVLDEANKQDIGSVAHLAQTNVAQVNALLRPVRGDLRRPRCPAVASRHELQQRAASVRPGCAPMEPYPSAGQRRVERLPGGA
jgi:hypothetical protein